MTKRIVAMALCLCMVLTMLPADALAAEQPDAAEIGATRQEESGGY